MKLLSTFSCFLASSLATKLTTVYQFPNGTWLENIAPMHNGSLLVTIIGRAEIYMINPTVSPATSALVASIPDHNVALGITELQHDRFAIAVGNVTASNTPVPETWSVWTLDLTSSTPTAAKLADVKNISMINGLTKLNARTLLLADSWAGNIVKLDIETKESTVVLADASLASNFSSPSLQLGVNGLRVSGEYVYFSNTVLSLLGRVKVDPVSGAAVGKYEIIASGEEISQPDDFAVAGDGSVFLARPMGDTIQHVGLDGKVETLAKGGLASGPTSMVFGKGSGEGKWLFVTESGLEGGVPTIGGRVVKVEL